MDPASILSQEANNAIIKLDQEWSSKYQQLNKLYDWDRHKKDPDEINRLRNKLEQDINSRRQQIRASFQNQMSKFNMLDQLFEHDPAQANKLKWEATVGKDIANRMFPQQRDPGLELQRNLNEQNDLLDIVEANVVANGKLYEAKTKKEGNTVYFTKEADRSKPVSQDGIQKWVLAKNALVASKQKQLDILAQFSESGLPNPAYLQSLQTDQRREGWFKQWYRETGMRIRGATKEDVMRGRIEPSGTFAQKVQQTVVKPQARKQEPVQQSRAELLMEYKRLGGSNTPEGRTFADKYLRK